MAGISPAALAMVTAPPTKCVARVFARSRFRSAPVLPTAVKVSNAKQGAAQGPLMMDFAEVTMIARVSRSVSLEPVRMRAAQNAVRTATALPVSAALMESVKMKAGKGTAKVKRTAPWIASAIVETAVAIPCRRAPVGMTPFAKAVATSLKGGPLDAAWIAPPMPSVRRLGNASPNLAACPRANVKMMPTALAVEPVMRANAREAKVFVVVKKTVPQVSSATPKPVSVSVVMAVAAVCLPVSAFRNATITRTVQRTSSACSWLAKASACPAVIQPISLEVS